MGQGNVVLPLNFDANNKNVAITQTFTGRFIQLGLFKCSYVTFCLADGIIKCVCIHVYLLFRYFKHFLFISKACKNKVEQNCY